VCVFILDLPLLRSGSWKTKKMLNTTTWLECEAADRFHVAKVKCGVCVCVCVCVCVWIQTK